MQAILAELLAGRNLTRDEAEHAFGEVLGGRANESQVGAMLALLQVKGVTVDELVGGARVMRAHATSVPLDPARSQELRRGLVDTCGTGGTPKTFNISTAAALVTAAGGAIAARETPGGVRVRVAKHGGRSRSGRGSAEVLAALGVNIDAEPAVQARCLEEVGVCFSFAVNHHPAMKFAAGPRKSLGFPTVFNLLGPLCNPAGARRQVMGVYDASKVELVASALAELGAEEALVVHGRDGMDEITTTDRTIAAHVRRGGVELMEIDASALGVARARLSDLTVASLDEGAELVRRVLGGEPGPARDIVALNAGAALMVGGACATLAEGLALAHRAIESAASEAALGELIRLSNLERP